MNTTTRNTRNVAFDFLKAMAILLVIFNHNRQLNPNSVIDNFFMLLSNVAVPCFFMVSGGVFFHRPFDMKKHSLRMVSFYSVFVVWRAIYLLFFLYYGAPFDGSIRTILSYLLLFQTYDGVITGHFWFMEGMLSVMLIAPILHLCYEQKKDNLRLLGYLLAVLFLFNQVPATGNLIISVISDFLGKPTWDIAPIAQILPFSFRYSNYVTYYLLGALLMDEKDRFSQPVAIALPCVGILGLFLIKFIQTGIFTWGDVYLESGYYWISTMLISCGLFLLTLRIPQTPPKIITFIGTQLGSHTLGVFYLHILLIQVLTPTLFAPLSAYNGWILNLLESILICVLALIIGYLFKKIPLLRTLF